MERIHSGCRCFQRASVSCRMCCVVRSSDESITFFPTVRTTATTANTNGNWKGNRIGWVGTKIQLWYCTSLRLYIRYIKISSASFDLTGHIARPTTFSLIDTHHYSRAAQVFAACVDRNRSHRDRENMRNKRLQVVQSIPFSFFSSIENPKYSSHESITSQTLASHSSCK